MSAKIRMYQQMYATILALFFSPYVFVPSLDIPGSHTGCWGRVVISLVAVMSARIPLLWAPGLLVVSRNSQPLLIIDNSRPFCA
jgi:hypothetical protein